jgi:hypothetical protein
VSLLLSVIVAGDSCTWAIPNNHPQPRKNNLMIIESQGLIMNKFKATTHQVEEDKIVGRKMLARSCDDESQDLSTPQRELEWTPPTCQGGVLPQAPGPTEGGCGNFCILVGLLCGLIFFQFFDFCG